MVKILEALNVKKLHSNFDSHFGKFDGNSRLNSIKELLIKKCVNEIPLQHNVMQEPFDRLNQSPRLGLPSIKDSDTDL